MDYRVRSIALSQIDSGDRTFQITTHTDHTDLAASISVMGLLQPPLIVRKGNAHITVLGFRRIAACRAIGLTQIPARVDIDHPPGIRHAALAIADNASQRQLNVVEQSRALALLQRFGQDAVEESKAIAKAVGLSHSQAALTHLRLVSDMPESLQMAIVDGSIALPVAIAIGRLNPDDGKALADFLQRMNTGLNNQRELMEVIVELSIMQNRSVAQLLDEKPFAAIISDADTPLPQRVQRLRQAFKKMRYPELTRAETAFRQAFNALNVSKTIQLQPPRFFEGKTFCLTLPINSRRQLKALLPDLEKIANQPDLLPE